MKTESKALLALAVVCILWGTTYLVIKIGIVTIPPFLFSGVRQLLAGALLWAVLPFLKQKIKLTRRDIFKQVLPGLLMIFLGNGIITWAEKYIPSGLAALIVSAMPIYVTAINFGIGKETSVGKQTLIGLSLGALGIVLMFRDNLADLANSGYFWGIIASFAASFSWAIGTVYMKVNTFRTNSFVNSAIQFTSGGIALLITSFVTEDYSGLNAISAEGVWSLLYLVMFGSIIPFMCYLYAIERLKVELVSVYAYINPFIALILGMIVLNERLTGITGLAFIATVGGVYFINKGNNRKRASVESKSEGSEVVVVAVKNKDDN
ncbi:MAG TPA: EamA family transporter [Bacteroidia bacterium]|jgi:drug/metabolite transporter (DMT)-like permease|nr:EamA family transporter [Bacteroidia bacterium]